MDSRNVTEVKPKTSNKLETMFGIQKNLVHKYKEIEGMPSIPMGIQEKDAQAWLKDFCWRIVEELMEAAEYLIKGNDSDKILFEEEISDAFHFLLELTILAGYDEEIIYSMMKDLRLIEKEYVSGKDGDPLDIILAHLYRVEKRNTHIGDTPYSFFADLSFPIIYQLGLLGNTLKNKRWKQSEVETDEVKFCHILQLVYYYFFILCASMNFMGDKIYDIYFKKSKVNEFRQDTKY